jgi:hypothetical protein
MDEHTDIAQRGIQYAQDQFSEVMTQTGEFVREKPGQSLLIALAAGFVLNRLPVGRLLGTVVRLLLFALKPALLVYGATKVYEAVKEEER